MRTVLSGDLVELVEGTHVESRGEVGGRLLGYDVLNALEIALVEMLLVG